MFKRVLVRALLPLSALSAPFALAHCAATPAEESSAVGGEALAALGADEVLGAITYGQTTAPVAYTSPPRYRAYRWTGAAGDKVTAVVHSGDGNPRAWVLDAAFNNVAYDDNANGSARDAHVTATLPADGTYYIAFREAHLSDATFTATLASAAASVDAGGACDPETQNCADAGPAAASVVPPSVLSQPLSLAGTCYHSGWETYSDYLGRCQYSSFGGDENWHATVTITRDAQGQYDVEGKGYVDASDVTTQPTIAVDGIPAVGGTGKGGTGNGFYFSNVSATIDAQQLAITISAGDNQPAPTACMLGYRHDTRQCTANYRF